MAAIARAPSFAALVRRLTTNASPLVRSATAALIADSTLWPEGVDVDPRTGHYFVASVRHRTVVETSGTIVRELSARRPTVGAMLGVRVDTARRAMWATTANSQMEGYAPGDSAIAALLRIRPVEAPSKRRWDLPPSPGGHTLGDVTSARAATSSPRLPRTGALSASPGRRSLEALATSALPVTPGMAPTPDGRDVYVADWSHGLLRVDLDGAPSPASSTRRTRRRSAAMASRGTARNRLRPERRLSGTHHALRARPQGMRIARADVLDRNSAMADEPTIGTFAGRSFVYVANSQWEKYTDDGMLRPGPALRPRAAGGSTALSATPCVATVIRPRSQGDRMPAYVVADITIHDPVTYERYREMVPPSIAQYGGRYALRGAEVERLEGSWNPGGSVLPELTSPRRRVPEWESPEYADAKAVRQAGALAQMLLVGGPSLDPGA